MRSIAVSYLVSFNVHVYCEDTVAINVLLYGEVPTPTLALLCVFPLPLSPVCTQYSLCPHLFMSYFFLDFPPFSFFSVTIFLENSITNSLAVFLQSAWSVSIFCVYNCHNCHLTLYMYYIVSLDSMHIIQVKSCTRYLLSILNLHGE